jgi:N-methylhydantoinase A
MFKGGVDVGGTFTDVVVYAGGELRSVKVLTDPRNPWRSVLEGLSIACGDLAVLREIVLATTLGTNLFIGQVNLDAPPVLLIANEGFRDVIEIGRQNRPELYNLFFEKPKPLVPRSMRLGVRGRIDAKGNVVEELDVEAVRGIAKQWCGKVSVAVVSFLHSYANPIHELEARKAIKEVCPDLDVVLSHEVDPQPGEFERTSTALVNAILRPVVSRYLAEVRERLERSGFNGRLLVMQSSGGVADLSLAVEKPAMFIESGPAAGAIAAAHLSKALGLENVLSFDMGGTTAKLAAVVGGTPLLTEELELGAKAVMGRRVRGSGYPVRHPSVDLAEIGAGGGTIAWVDAGGSLRVGPMSAGADPGPACYGRGGREPTVADASCVLNRLPEALAGGRLKVKREFALEAVRKLADQLGMGVEEAASAVVEVADTMMAKAARLVTVEKGHDPSDFALLAFGGAGPLHAAGVSRELGIPKFVVPPMAGVFSALGLLFSDYRVDLVRSVLKAADEVDDALLEEAYAEMEAEAVERLKGWGVREDGISLVRLARLRYRGRGGELELAYRGGVGELIESFYKAHELKYGFKLPGEVVEVVSLRVAAVGEVEKPRLQTSELVEHKPEPEGYREVFFEDWERAAVYARSRLKPGALITGPAVVESEDSTVLLPPGSEARVDGLGCLVVEVRV